MNPKWISAYMKSAEIFAELSYCKRRQVGAIIVKDDRIISIGYNGTPAGFDNCCEDEENNTLPYVLHAESNAITKLAKCHESGNHSILFTTTAPCIECAKLIIQTGIRKVYYKDIYRNRFGLDLLDNFGINNYEVKL